MHYKLIYWVPIFLYFHFNTGLKPRSSFESQITEDGSLSTLPFSLKVLDEAWHIISELLKHNAFKYYFAWNVTGQLSFFRRYFSGFWKPKTKEGGRICNNKPWIKSKPF